MLMEGAPEAGGGCPVRNTTLLWIRLLTAALVTRDAKVEPSRCQMVSHRHPTPPHGKLSLKLIPLPDHASRVGIVARSVRNSALSSISVCHGARAEAP